jgi:hypothetical protein
MIERDLTAEEDSFCQLYISNCENGTKAVDLAWRKPDGGPAYSYHYCRVKSVDLLAKPSIQTRLIHYKNEFKAKLGISDYGFLKKTIELRDKAEGVGDYKTALYAQVIIARVLYTLDTKSIKTDLSKDGTIKIEFSNGDI